jgi:uncharacterized membrane protein
MKFEESIIIDHPVAEVFRFVSNFRSHKKFSRTFRDSKQITKGTVGIGTELYHKVIFLGRRIETNSEVTAFEPNKQFAFKSTSGPIPEEFEYRFEALGGQTQVRFIYDVEPGSFFKMGEYYLRPRIEEEVTVSMQQLKKVLEMQSA